LFILFALQSQSQNEERKKAKIFHHIEKDGFSLKNGWLVTVTFVALKLLDMVFTDEKTLTVREFLDLDLFEDGFFYELINGEIVKRASPDTEHQSTASNLSYFFQAFVREKKLGKVFFAPYDVYLDEENLVQPDLIFVSQGNGHIIQKGCIMGVPDLVVEILSPGTYRTDRGAKFKLYQRLGVAEYWIADPRGKTIEVYALNAGTYDLIAVGEEGSVVESLMLAGLNIAVNEVFG